MFSPAAEHLAVMNHMLGVMAELPARRSETMRNPSVSAMDDRSTMP